MKYAIWPGEEFYERMLQSSRSDEERSVVMLLWRTGMHSSTLVEQSFKLKGKQGYGHYCLWRRPKNKVWLRAKVPGLETRLIRRCIAAGSLPASQGILRRWLRRIGDRAGYAEQAVSPLTFRHSRAVYLLDGDEKAGRKPMPMFRVAKRMGCSVSVLEGHYAVIEDERGY